MKKPGLLKPLHAAVHPMLKSGTCRRMGTFLLLLIALNVSGNAQTVDWVRSGTLNNSHTPRAIRYDHLGHLIVFGAMSDTLQFTGTASLADRGQGDCFLASMNPNNTFNWIKQIGGTGYDYALDVTTDKHGNIYILGLFDDTLQIGNQYLVSEGATDLYFAKFDNAGTLSFVKQIKSPGDQALPFAGSIAADDSGNIYIAGGINTDTDFGDSTLHSFAGGPSVGQFPSDAYLCKYDAGGALIWSKLYQSSNNEVLTTVQVSATGYIYTMGFFSGTADFGGIQKTSAGLRDMVLMKVSPSGNTEWLRSYGGNKDDDPGNLVLSNNSLYFVGVYTDSITIGGTTLIRHYKMNTGTLLTRIDTNGNNQWVKGYLSPTWIPRMSINAKGQIAFSGAFQRWAILDTFNLFSAVDPNNPSLTTDGFVVHCDSLGNVKSVIQSQQSVLDDLMLDIDMDNSGNVYTSGNTQSPGVQWGPYITPGTLFIMKIKPAPGQVSVAGTTVPKAFAVYPNPAGDLLYWSSGEPVQHLEVYNALGALVFRQDCGGRDHVDIHHLSPGNYFFKFVAAGSTIRKMITKQ